MSRGLQGDCTRLRWEYLDPVAEPSHPQMLNEEFDLFQGLSQKIFLQSV